MRARALRCLRCSAEQPVGPFFTGCPRCRARGHPANLSVAYDDTDVIRAVRSARGDGAGHGTDMWRYRDLLPVEEKHIVSLGEGGTPLVPVPRMGRALGIPHLYVKDESRNPTGSFKDRLAAAAVSMAQQMGRRVITGSSSGNAGAAAAALAARAGLPCVMFTTQQFPLAMRTQMAVLGAFLLAAPTIKDRWALVQAGVEELGWFPVTVFGYPYVGSNCYGIEGYKTIGYEIVDQLGGVPDHLVVPVGAGDAFTGIWKGLTEYLHAGVVDAMPRMHAAEVFGPLEHALAEGRDDCVEVPTDGATTVAISVGSNLSTYQALHVLRQTGGGARRATNQEMVAAQRDLARYEGLYVETSSALSLAALPRMVADGLVDPEGTVVAVLTSTGLKDPETTARHLPPIPSCGPSLDDAIVALRTSYGFDPADAARAGGLKA